MLKQLIQTVAGGAGPNPEKARNGRWLIQMRLFTHYKVSVTPLSAGSDYAATAPHPLTFHNQRSPHAKASHITYVGAASTLTDVSGDDECEVCVNWCFRRARACSHLTVAPADCFTAEVVFSGSVHIVTVSMAASRLILPSSPTYTCLNRQEARADSPSCSTIIPKVITSLD